MNAAVVVLGLAGALLAVALFAVATARRPCATPAVYGAGLALTAVLFVVALSQLLAAGPPQETSLPLGLPWLGAHFRIDALSAFFLALLGLGGSAANLYALGYGRHEEEPQRVLPFLPAFLAAMTLVLLADDAFTFLLSWEFMSLVSWALVLSHHHAAENRQAAYVYLAMAGFGTLALLFAFGLLAGTEGGYSFAAMRAAQPGTIASALVLALALAGAGSKAGLAPLHVWLPLAHPAAPSYVSALMSGVMTKVAVYGFIRIVFDLNGSPYWWTSIPLVLGGAGTAAIGILWATMERDVKRALAWSTIENIGVIFAALGLALAFRANAMLPAAALALTAALFHALNHTVFKSLLFFGAGAVLTATGERDLEKLGGLIHRMPQTAFAVLVASAAISALPPLNGFASEWLLFQAILQSPDLPQWALKVFVPAAGGLLALAAALAAAAFVRLYGVGFLGRARSQAAAGAREVDRAMQAAMLGLAALCLIFGIFPGYVIDALSPVVRDLAGATMPGQSWREWFTIVPVSESRSSYNGLLVFVFIAMSASLAAFVVHRTASRAVRRSIAWGCGFDEAAPAAQYSASSFSQPIRRVFGVQLMAAKETVDMPAPGEMRAARHSVSLTDHAWTILFGRIAGTVDGIAGRLNRLQFLTIRQYLSLVFVSLILLLLALVLWT